jgi:predicted ferric reductase
LVRSGLTCPPFIIDQSFRDYFVAALSLYASTYIFNFFRTAIQSLNAEAKFILLPDSTIQISIPTKMSWKPGQHVFLRFWALPGLHSYSMHPFTIGSLPSTGEMIFFVRSHRGFTGRLKKLVGTGYGTMAMSIDGPYGNTDTANRLASSDKALLITGGSGTGYLLPLLQSILQDPNSNAEVYVTIAVRQSISAHWIVDELQRVLEACTSNRKVQIDIHITDNSSSPQTFETSYEEESEKTALRYSGPIISRHKSITIIRGKGRPDLKELIRRNTTDAEKGTSVSITSCGPSSMGLDIRNACAKAQGRILQGKGGAGEVWLHCEAFGW